jgi:hypothetical protein
MTRKRVPRVPYRVKDKVPQFRITTLAALSSRPNRAWSAPVIIVARSGIYSFCTIRVITAAWKILT